MDDPYAAFSDHSKISSSQENLHQLNFHGHEPQASSPASDQDDFPVETTGIMICSPPDGSSSAEKDEDVEYHPTVEEEFQTPEEERFLTCSSEEEPPRRMKLDDSSDGTQYVDDALTVDLGKDNNSVVFSEEKSSPILETIPVDHVVEKSFENDNEVLKNALESTLEKNLGFLRRGSDTLTCDSEEAPESAVRNPLLHEDLGLSELQNEGLGGLQLNLPGTFEKNLNLNVVDNVELTRGEDCVGDVAEKIIESAAERNLGFLEGSSDDSSTCDSEKAPDSSMRKSLIEEDLQLIDSNNEGLVESPCNHSIEFENMLNLNIVDKVEPAIREDYVGDAVKTLESTVQENLGFLKCSLSCPPCDPEKAPESLIAVNENDVAINDSNELHLKSCSDNSKEDVLVLHHPDMPESSKDVVMEDAALIATEKDIRHDVHTDKVLGFDNMQTDELHNDDGNTNNKNKEKLDKSEYADSSNLHPEETLENPAGLRRLPNWVSEMEESTQSENRRARKEKILDLGQKKKAGEAEVLGHVGIRLANEGSDHSGKRFKEAKGSCRIIEVDLGHGGTRSVKKDSDYSGKSYAVAEVPSRVAEALQSRGQSQASKKSLDATCFRANQGSRGNDNSNKNNPQTKDIDILEVAVRAGLKLPRPRWWRPRGYEIK